MSLFCCVFHGDWISQWNGRCTVFFWLRLLATSSNHFYSPALGHNNRGVERNREETLIDSSHPSFTESIISQSITNDRALFSPCRFRTSVYRAVLNRGTPQERIATSERNFCSKCSTMLWLYDKTWWVDLGLSLVSSSGHPITICACSLTVVNYPFVLSIFSILGKWSSPSAQIKSVSISSSSFSPWISHLSQSPFTVWVFVWGMTH